MSKFDTKTMYSFEKYLELQHSGELNMVSSEVQTKLGISKEEHHFILENYSSLLEEFRNLKVVNELIEDAKARVDGKGNDEKSLGFSKDSSEKDDIAEESQ